MRGVTFWCHTRCFSTGIVKHSSNKALCQHITGVTADRTPQNIKACPHTSPISTAQRLALCWYSPSGLLALFCLTSTRRPIENAGTLPWHWQYGERLPNTMWARDETGQFVIWYPHQMKNEHACSGSIHWCATSRKGWITQTVCTAARQPHALKH